MYGEKCLKSLECNITKGLHCPTQNDQCDCPLISDFNFCDCKFEFFWNYTTAECGKYEDKIII